MIGKTVIGRSFNGCVNYNLSKVENGFGELLECRGVRDINRTMIKQDFNSRKTVNPKLTKCVWHTSLSFQDKLDSKQMLTIGKAWMKDMGLSNTQYVILRHNDTEHLHIHIIANRIDDEGKTISDSNNWKRSEAVCKQLTQRFNLTLLPSERNEKKIDRDKLRGRDLLKTDINRVIRQEIKNSRNLENFADRMNKKGFQCSLRYNPDSSIRGISFERGGIKIKASDIHKSLSAKNILAMIESNQEIIKAPNRTGTKYNPNSSVLQTLSNINKLGKQMEGDEDEEEKAKRKRGRGLSI
jgi:Relaxase/Mobilisation nuclease domain